MGTWRVSMKYRPKLISDIFGGRYFTETIPFLSFDRALTQLGYDSSSSCDSCVVPTGLDALLADSAAPNCDAEHTQFWTECWSPEALRRHEYSNFSGITLYKTQAGLVWNRMPLISHVTQWYRLVTWSSCMRPHRYFCANTLVDSNDTYVPPGYDFVVGEYGDKIFDPRYVYTCIN